MLVATALGLDDDRGGDLERGVEWFRRYCTTVGNCGGVGGTVMFRAGVGMELVCLM